MLAVMVTLTVGPQGRVVIPAQLRRQLGFDQGAELAAYVDEEDRLVIERRDQIIGKLQAEFVSLPYSMTDSLIAARRAESEHEGA